MITWNSRKRLTEFISFVTSISVLRDRERRARETMIQILKEFEHLNNIVLYTDSFTEEMNDRWVNFLKERNFSKKEGEVKYYMTNTIKSKCEKLTALLNKAHKYGYKVNLPALGKFNVRAITPDKVYLTMEELHKLNNMKLSKSQAKIRDLFLIGCLTALRFSDYSNLSAANFKGDVIQIITQKTKATVVIPIHPIIRSIIERNKGYDFLNYEYSLSNFNCRLRTIVRKAGFNQKIKIECIRGRERIYVTKRKYELIASHTARRTGATLMYLAGIPPFRIMLITGHVTEEAFYRYIRIQKTENAKELLEHEFFKE